MKKLLLFNPENDISLGYGKCRFTMSPLVKKLHDDGAMLPMWYAMSGDCVYANDVDARWLEEMSDMFGVDVSAGLSGQGCIGSPWGWSCDSMMTLKNVGAVVPDEMHIECIRQLSHRRTTIDVMNKLHQMLDFEIADVPVEADSIERVDDCLSKWGRVYIKSPWSSSGRGVFEIDSLDERTVQRVNSIIRKQGCVLVERAYNCKRDFAMLFHSTPSGVEFFGYSVFFNERGNAYGGNIMSDNDALEDIIVASGANKSQLTAVSSALTAVFTGLIAPVYTGYFGVDMIITREGMINPCVEINLRMTMGVVASIWYARYMSPKSQGIFRVKYEQDEELLPRSFPSVVNGRLVSGVVNLTPPKRDGFNFTVETLEV